jgi:hypothetical protein
MGDNENRPEDHLPYVRVDEDTKPKLVAWLTQKIELGKKLQIFSVKTLTDNLIQLKETSIIKRDIFKIFRGDQIVTIYDPSFKERLLSVIDYKIRTLPQQTVTYTKLKDTLRDTDTIQQRYIDILEQSEPDMKEQERLKKQNKRISEKTLVTYTFPKEEEDYWADNYSKLISQNYTSTTYADKVIHGKARFKPIAYTSLTIERVMTFLRNVGLDSIVTQPRVEEAVSYFNVDCQVNYGLNSFKSGPYVYHMFLQSLIEEGIVRVKKVMEGLSSIPTDGDYNCIVSVGSGMKGDEILPHDKMFQDHFLTRRRTVVLIFERSTTESKGAQDPIYIFNYIKTYYNVELGKEIKITLVNDFMTIYSFPFKATTIELVNIESYYIPAYKPFLRYIVTGSNQSMFMESISCFGGIKTFSCDKLIMNHFTYFFYHGYFVVNINKLKRRGNEDIYEFVTSLQNPYKRNEEFKAILKKSEEDPRYKQIIRLLDQPNPWTILEDAAGHATNQYWQYTFGGVRGRKTRKRHCRTRRFRKN